jgi:tetratricopeptide (TPR) repeat protein
MAYPLLFNDFGGIDMYAEFGSCPRCQFDIAPERRQDSVVICDHCGFVISNSETEFREKGEKRFIISAFAIAFVMIAGFLQLCSWDNHFLEVIPLQIKDVVGSMSNEDYEQLANICLDRKKLDCVEHAYSKLGERDQNQLLRLGKFEMSRGHYSEAANTYRTFFTKGGVDLEASYNFARALGQIGMVDEAAKYYDYVLGAKPDVLQVTVVQNYVRLLMEANRLDQAQKLIESVRKQSDTATMFMEDEYQKIKGKSS